MSARALVEQELYRPPSASAPDPGPKPSEAWAAAEAALREQLAQTVPADPGLEVGGRPKRWYKRAMHRLFRPVSRRYDRIAADLAELGTGLAERVEQVELDVRGVRDTTAPLRRQMADLSMDLSRLSGDVAAGREDVAGRLDAISGQVASLSDSVDAISGRVAGLEDIAGEVRDLSGRLREHLEGVVRTSATAPHPEPLVPPDIAEAREAFAAAGDVGYEERVPAYRAVFEEMLRLGLRAGDYMLDIGPGSADLDRFLRDQGWWGVYVPAGPTIDGTDIAKLAPQGAFNFVVLENALEHVDNWEEVLDRAEEVAGAVVVLTRNGEAEVESDVESPLGLRTWLIPEDLERRGYDVSVQSLFGDRDTILASRVWTSRGR